MQAALANIFVFLLSWFLLVGCSTTEDALPDSTSCRFFLVIPPSAKDERVSDYVANRWMAIERKKLSGCDKFVPFSAGKKSLAVVNVTHLTTFDFDNLKAIKLEVAAEKNSATDVVFLNYNLAGRTLAISPIVYSVKDLKSPRKGTEFSLTELVLGPSDLRRIKPKSLSLFFASLVPNAVTLGLSSGQMTNKFELYDKVKVVSSHERSKIPKIVSGLGFTNLSHPAGFNTFDYEFRAFTSLGFSAVDSAYRFQQLDENGGNVGDPVDYSLRFYFAASFLNAGVSLYWPLGTTFFSFGFGPGVYSLKDSYGKGGVYTVVATRLHLGHRAFLSERLFLQMAFESMGTTAKPFVNNKIYKSTAAFSGSLGLGYFLPELKSTIGSRL